MKRTTLWVLLCVSPAISLARPAVILPEQGSAARPAAPMPPPEDPLYPWQWALENTGQLGGLPDADIDAEGAWELSLGSRDILVGVLDTGIDVTHPDLVDALWVNQAELAGEPGVDDDGNGCPDDVHGCAFSRGCSESTPGCAPEPAGDLQDPGGHGTSVAGIIAATSGNEVGMRGVAPQVKLVGIEVGTSDAGYFWDVPVDRAIDYAIAVGVDVLNISAYFDGPDLALQEAALERATDAGILVVASAGNWGVDLEVHEEELPYLPGQSDNPGVLQIAAVDQYDRLIFYPGWWGSCYGAATVDVAGPSQGIVAPIPVEWQPSDPYRDSFNGTSASAPFVSGVAALVWSIAPELTAQQVARVVMDSGDVLPDLIGTTVSGRRVNAANAVRVALGEAAPPVADAGPDLAAEVGEAVTLDGGGSSHAGGEELTYTWSWRGETLGQGPTLEWTPPMTGDQIVTLEVRTASGLRASDRVVVKVPAVWERTGFAVASPHPVVGDEVWEIYLPETTWMRLHFERLEITASDSDYPAADDAVAVYDGSGTQVWATTESVVDRWSPPIPVSGPVTLVMDVRAEGPWGVSIDEIEYALPLDEAEGACGGCASRSGEGSSPAGALGLLVGVVVARRGRGVRRSGSRGSRP